MQDILEELYEMPLGSNIMYHEPDSDFVEYARVKSASLDKLLEQLTDEQKELFEAYSEANGEIMEIRSFNKFTYGFHLGASLMMKILAP